TPSVESTERTDQCRRTETLKSTQTNSFQISGLSLLEYTCFHVGQKGGPGEPGICSGFINGDFADPDSGITILGKGQLYRLLQSQLERGCLCKDGRDRN